MINWKCFKNKVLWYEFIFFLSVLSAENSLYHSFNIKDDTFDLITYENKIFCFLAVSEIFVSMPYCLKTFSFNEKSKY